MSEMSVLITGGSGFIGRHLVSRLLAKGEKVTLLLRPTSTIPDSFKNKITPILCDDWTEQGIFECLKGHHFSKIYHLASYGVVPDHRDIPTIIFMNTVLPSLLVTLAARHKATMVMAGSSAEYAPLQEEERLTEKDMLEDGKLYGSSKAAGTLLALSVATANAVSLKVLRLFNVYGSGEADHRLLPSLVKSLRAEQKVSLSPGQQIRDFIHVDDVIEALVVGHTPLNDAPLASVYNVCTGQGESVRRYCELTASLIGSAPSLLDFGAMAMRPDETEFLVGNPSKIRSEMGWQARYTLETGLRHTLVSMKIINS